MKKALMVTAALLVLVLAFAGSADAKCGVGCLNHKLSKLSKSLKKAEEAIAAQSQTIAQQSQALAAANGAQAQTAKEVKTLYSCLNEVPMLELGDPGGSFGYVFRFEEKGTPQEVETSAVDFAFPGDPVDAWVLSDSCKRRKPPRPRRRAACSPPQPA